MKKISIIAICLLVILSSCKKENSGSNYHITFYADGVQKSYTGYAVFHKEDVSGDIELTILGAKTATSFDDYFGIYINNYPGGGNIPAGQYTDNSTDFTVLSTFQNGASKEYESGQSMAEDAAYYNIPIANHFKVNITSMDSKTAKGTFSGDYFLDGDVKSTKISITNGDFYVKYQ